MQIICTQECFRINNAEILQVKVYVTAYLHIYACVLVLCTQECFGEWHPRHFASENVFLYFAICGILVSTAAQSSKLVLSGGGLELPSLGGSSPRAEGGISWEYAEDS